MLTAIRETKLPPHRGNPCYAVSRSWASNGRERSGHAGAGARARARLDVLHAQLGAALRATAAVRYLAAALAVEELPRRAVLRVVPVAPVDHRHRDRPKVAALGGETVLVPLRVVLVAAPLEHPLRHQAVEPVREDRAGHAQAALEVVEPADAEERVAHDQHRPALAHDLERASDRAVLVVVGSVKHLT